MMRVLAIATLVFLSGWVIYLDHLPQTGVSAQTIGSVERYTGAARRAIGGLTGQ